MRGKTISKNFILSEEKTRILNRLKKPSKGFYQVIEVHNILRNGKSFQTAVYEISQKYKVEESTIRDACCRRLNLTTKEFVNLSKYRENFASMLKRNFPNRTKEIDDLLK